jgi:hypothetical protein
MSQDKIYIKPVGGLCNRLRALGSATQIANQANKRLVVFWGRDEHLNCKFSDLFMPSPYFDVIEEKQLIGKKALFPYLPGSEPTTSIRKSLNWLSCKILNIKHLIWFEDFDNAVAPLVREVNPKALNSMKAFEINSFTYIKQLLEPVYLSGSTFLCTAWKLTQWQNYKELFVPVSTIQEKIDALSEDFDNTIGVHIRRSDHMSATTFSQLHKFELAMQEALENEPRTNFYLATDCKQSEHQLKNTFGGRVRIFQKRSLDRNTPIGIQEGVTDLYTLAKTRKLLGSYFSSFSQVAAEIYGIEEETVL